VVDGWGVGGRLWERLAVGGKQKLKWAISQ
jgi:hypothetical protein